jgi:glycosyltransferase involved in cell wall biosynthesis
VSAGTAWEPRVTVGIPAYNAERFIASAIEGMLAQTFTNIEIVVSDNASTDGTADIVHDYIKRDARVRYERSPVNVGVARNFNRLVGLARAPYFRWAATDDLNHPTSIERCLPVIEADPSIALVYPKTTLINAQGRTIRDYDDNLHIVDERPSVRFRRFFDQIGLCNALFGIMRTETMRRTGLWGVFVGADIPFLAEMTLWGKFWEVPEYLFQRRFHETASSALSAKQLGAFYDPAGGERNTEHLRARQHLVANFKSAMRAPLSLTERMAALRVVARESQSGRERHFTRGVLPAAAQKA